MVSERTGRIFRLSLVAWIAMVGVMAVMGGVKWDQPGFRDSDGGSPLQIALTFSIVMAIPFAILTAGVLAPCALVADRILLGRLTRVANLAVGASFAVPSLLAFLAIGWLTLGGRRNFSEWVRILGGTPDLVIGFFIVFAVGGVVVSLGMRRRSKA